MGVPNKIPVRHVAHVLLVLALLVNPELRVMVLFADSLGLELVVLLLTLQLRSTSSLLVPFAQTLNALSCSAAFQMGSLGLGVYQKALVLRRLDRLICPLLIIVSYGLRCRVAIQNRLTSRWYRLATAKRRCSRHSGVERPLSANFLLGLLDRFWPEAGMCG
jgi:hypothetical protein